MKLLAVSDEIVSWIYSPQLADRCRDVDFVASCGDLPNDYLEYIATTLGKPCFYVHGNHDRADQRGPEGWINLDLQRYHLGRLQLAGLEGSPRYKPGAPFQYTQSDQWLRALWLARKMVQGLVRRGRGADIILSHAPLRGIHDGTDPAHIGFDAFNWLAKAFKPRFWLHGHQHRNYAPMQMHETRLGNTLVVNIHPYRILELPDTT